MTTYQIEPQGARVKLGVCKERPILMSAPMAKAILAGTKTQTRRIVKPQPVPIPDDIPRLQPYDATGYWWACPAAQSMVSMHDAACVCPHGTRGDHLWVRETWRATGNGQTFDNGKIIDSPRDGSQVVYAADAPGDPGPWRPSIFMFRHLSRITLEITGVRVEQLQSISEADAITEGIRHELTHGMDSWWLYDGRACMTASPVESYRTLWESINGKGSWEFNPWVWVIEFRKVGV